MNIQRFASRLARNLSRSRSTFTSKGLRFLIRRGRHYAKVVSLHEKGLITANGAVAEIVGYCYYQLAKYKEAIPLLQAAIRDCPAHYYPRFFLAICFRALNKNAEAIDQLLELITLDFPQIDEILDILLPLAAGDFSKVAKAIEGRDLSDLNRVKVLFYQRRDNEIKPGMLKGMQLRKFFDAKSLAAQGHGTYMPLGEAEKLRFVRLEDNSDIWVDTRPPYVAEIRDAVIGHNSSLILVGEDKILCDTLANADYGHFVILPNETSVVARRDDALLIKEPKPEVEIPEGIWMSGHASSAYGHWFAEFLPKLRFYEKHPRFSRLPLIIDARMPQAHYEFLAALAPNPIHIVPTGGSIKVKNLLVAPADTFFPTQLEKSHTVPPEQQSSQTVGGLRYMGGKIVAHFGAPRNPSSRIFLSRRNSQWRKMINEKEVIKILRKFGFKVVYAENLSFEEQVRTFQDAAFIVAPNGSATNNLIFAAPKAKLLILGQKNHFNWGGWFGSFMELGYSVTYLNGEAIGGETEKHSDYAVPAARLRAKVVDMLNS